MSRSSPAPVAALLTDAQVRCLRWLADRGGDGYLDQRSCVNAQGEAKPSGSWPAWLALIAKGFIAGGGGRIRVTPAGADLLAAHYPRGTPVGFLEDQRA